MRRFKQIAVAMIEEHSAGYPRILTHYVGVDEQGEAFERVVFPGEPSAWHPLEPLPPVVPAKSPDEQGYVHVDGADFRNITASLGLIEQLAASTPPEYQPMRDAFARIGAEAAAVRARLAAIRKGARTA